MVALALPCLAALACGRLGFEVVDEVALDAGITPATDASGARDEDARAGAPDLADGPPDTSAAPLDAAVDGGAAGGGGTGSGGTAGGTGSGGTGGGTAGGGTAGAGGTGSGGTAGAGGGAAGAGGGAAGAGGGAAGSGGTAGAGSGGAPAVPADWSHPAWRRRTRIEIDASTLTGSLDDFPVAVLLAPGRVDYAAARTDGADLRFIDGGGATLLAHEIERWQPGGASAVWVKLPRITGGTRSGFFWMYHGNRAASPAAHPNAVWSNDFAGVWHLQDARDSSPLGHDGTESNVTRDRGRVGDAARFDGMSGGIALGNRNTLAGLFAGGGTLTAWIFPDGWGQGAYGRILDRAADNLARGGFGLQLDNGAAPNRNLHFERGFSGGVGKFETPAGSIALGRWQHVAVVYDDRLPGNLPRMFLDGTEVPVMALPAPTGTPDTEFGQSAWIGNSTLADRTFHGRIDELRVARTSRSATWIRAEVLSESDQLLVFRATESLD